MRIAHPAILLSGLDTRFPDLLYHVVLTERCNLCCSYCSGTRHVEGIPLEVSYDVAELVNFIRHDSEAVIGFYGGEPTLAFDKMYEIMDRIPAKAFTLQTNVTYLDKIDPTYLKRLDTILISVDGGREVTDANRHEGVYDTVISNRRNIWRKGDRNDARASVGDIRNSTTESLQDILPVGEPCSLCPDKWVCEGRCLFANKTMFWGEEWFKRVCTSTRHMIRELGTLVEQTKSLMRGEVLQPNALDYPRINNGCEIIP
jgi:sulfatase maturation enzyme AslB (radical SAM superfamily)